MQANVYGNKKETTEFGDIRTGFLETVTTKLSSERMRRNLVKRESYEREMVPHSSTEY